MSKYFIHKIGAKVIGLIVFFFFIFVLFYPPNFGKGKIQLNGSDNIKIYIQNENCIDIAYNAYFTVNDSQTQESILQICKKINGTKLSNFKEYDSLNDTFAPVIYLTNESVAYFISPFDSYIFDDTDINCRFNVLKMEKKNEYWEQNWHWISYTTSEDYINLLDLISNYSEDIVVRIF